MDKIITKSFEEARAAGAELARKLTRETLRRGSGQAAVVLALSGDLGAGKTTFLQGFAKGLGIEEVVNSPTFIIMKKFEIRNSKFEIFYHFDLYRLENEKDVEFLNFKEIIADPKNIIAIEWPEKIAGILPENIISIVFKHMWENKREIIIN